MAYLLNTPCELCSPQENERTKDLIIEQKFHRTIIGQKGERIREIREKFPEVRILGDEGFRGHISSVGNRHVVSKVINVVSLSMGII